MTFHLQDDTAKGLSVTKNTDYGYGVPDSFASHDLCVVPMNKLRHSVISDVQIKVNKPVLQWFVEQNPFTEIKKK